MHRKTNFVLKLITIIVLQAFCVTQAGFAATIRQNIPVTYGKNLRALQEKENIDAKAGGNPLEEELQVALNTVLGAANSIGITELNPQNQVLSLTTVGTLIQNRGNLNSAQSAFPALITAYFANRSKSRSRNIPTDFADIVLDILEFARRSSITKQLGIRDSIPSAREVRAAIASLKEKAPNLQNPNCVSQAIQNVLSDPEINFPDEIQSDPSREFELFSAIATAFDIIASGSINFVNINDATGTYQVLKHSALATLATIQTLEEYQNQYWLNSPRDKDIWYGITITPESLKPALGQGRTVLAILGEDHLVLIDRYDTENNTIVYLDVETTTTIPGQKVLPVARSMPADEFFKRWQTRPDGSLAEKMIALVNWPLDTEEILDANELSQIKVGCGIIRFSGIASDWGFAAAQDMAYRGQDNYGETVVDLIFIKDPSDSGKTIIKGKLRNIKAQGPPRGVLYEIQMNGRGFPEEVFSNKDIPFERILDLTEYQKQALINYQAGRLLNNEEMFILHELWRNLTPIQQESISQEALKIRNALADKETRDDADITALSQSGEKPLTRYDLYPLTYNERGEVIINTPLTAGTYGSTFSGEAFEIGTHENILSVIKRIREIYKYDIVRARDIILFELQYTLEEEGLATEEINSLMNNYRRLVDRQISDEISVEQKEPATRLTPEEKRIWNKTWAHMADKKICVAGYYSADPLRHIFRLQSRIIALFGKNREWQYEVDEIFHILTKNRKPGWEWASYWQQENSLNIALTASEAFTIWFQRTFIPDEVITDRGIIPGVVDPLTLQYMYFVDSVLRHDRWATTGSKEPKDAQPHTDTGILNGLNDKILGSLLEDFKKNNVGLKGEDFVQKFYEYIRMHLDAHPENKGYPARALAHNGDLDASVQARLLPILHDNGILNETEDNETILTDTWKLIAYWECIYNWVRLDKLQGLTENGLYINKPEDAAETTRHAFMPKKLQREWNKLINLHQRLGRLYNSDEIALRLALMEFSDGLSLRKDEETPDGLTSVNSEMALSIMSLMTATPETQIAVSHRRDVYIGIVEDEFGNESAQVASDSAALLRAFDPAKVEEGIRRNQLLWKQLEDKVDAAQREMEEARIQLQEASITDEDFKQIETRFIDTVTTAFEEFEKVYKILISPFKLKRLYSLAGPQKFVKMHREFNGNTGKFEMKLEFTDFTGHPIDENNIKTKENVSVEIDAADKGGFRTYGEKEINQIPLVTLHSLVNYLKADGSVDMSAETMIRRFGERFGINIDEIKKWYRQAKELNDTTGERPMVIISGVGSSDNDALAAIALLKYLLPGVDIKSVSPAKILTTVSEYDPQRVLMIGLSWSGTTALTSEVLSWARTQEVTCISLTGNPEKEVGALTTDSGGTIKVNTGKEIAIYTTKGFSGILYDLFILAYYLSKEIEFEGEKNAKTETRQNEIFNDLYSLPMLLNRHIKSGPLDLNNPDSLVSQAGEHFKARSAWILIGDMPNNPITSEIGIKIGEVRNVPWANFDYSDSRFKNVARTDVVPDNRTGIFINATSPDRLREALENAEYCLSQGYSIIIQTYDTDNEILEKLAQLEKEYNGEGAKPRLFLVRAPRIHPRLQGLIDVAFGQKFCIGVARAALLSDESIDQPRNLAKSVTVKGVGAKGAQMNIDAFLNLPQFLVPQILPSSTMPYGYTDGHLVEHIRVSPANQAFTQYQLELHKRWRSLTASVDKNIESMPIRFQEILNYIFGPGFSLREKADFENTFGQNLQGLKRILVLTDTPESHIASLLADLPVSYVETVSTGYDSLFERRINPATNRIDENDVEIPINGTLFHIRYDQVEKKINLPDGSQLDVILDNNSVVGINPPSFTESASRREIFTFAGKQYKLSFDKKRGLIITAVHPDILGIEVVAANTASSSLEDEIGKDTLVVALSRPNYRAEREIDLQDKDIDNPLLNIDDAEYSVPEDAISEERLIDTLTTLKQKYSLLNSGQELPVCIIGMENSQLPSHANLGMAGLPARLDMTSSVYAYFAAFMRLAIELGDMKGISHMGKHKQALQKSHYLAESIKSDTEQRRKIREGFHQLNSTKSGHTYQTLLVIGGAQDSASTELYADALFNRGFTAKTLYVDESVHGPYACIDDDRSKFADPTTKTGINPDYDPNNMSDLRGKDVLSIILATDSRTYTASIIDAQRNRTRSGRIILVVKESDKNRQEVLDLGAYMVLTIPDSTNELTSVSHMALAQIVAEELKKSAQAKAIGNETFTQILEELNNLEPKPAVELANRMGIPIKLLQEYRILSRTHAQPFRRIQLEMEIRGLIDTTINNTGIRAGMAADIDEERQPTSASTTRKTATMDETKAPWQISGDKKFAFPSGYFREIDSRAREEVNDLILAAMSSQLTRLDGEIANAKSIVSNIRAYVNYHGGSQQEPLILLTSEETALFSYIARLMTDSRVNPDDKPIIWDRILNYIDNITITRIKETQPNPAINAEKEPVVAAATGTTDDALNYIITKSNMQRGITYVNLGSQINSGEPEFGIVPVGREMSDWNPTNEIKEKLESIAKQTARKELRFELRGSDVYITPCFSILVVTDTYDDVNQQIAPILADSNSNIIRIDYQKVTDGTSTEINRILQQHNSFDRIIVLVKGAAKQNIMQALATMGIQTVDLTDHIDIDLRLAIENSV